MEFNILMRKSVLTNLLISLVTIVLVVGAFASFQRKRSSFELIDFTFARRNGVIVVKNVDTGSGAARAEGRWRGNRRSRSGQRPGHRQCAAQ